MAFIKMMDFTVKTNRVEIVKSVPGLQYYILSYFQLYCDCFLLLNCVLFYGVDYSSLHICVILTTNLYVTLIFPVPIILNLLEKLALRIVLLVILHYCVITTIT